MHGFFFVTGGQIKVVTDQGFTGSDVRGGCFFFEKLERFLKAKFENKKSQSKV